MTVTNAGGLADAGPHHGAQVDRTELKEGWKPLTGAFLTYGLGPIIFLQTNALFVKPIMTETGMTASQVQTGSVVNLFVALSGVLVGLLVNRFGSRRLVLAGFAAMGALAILLAVLPPSPTIFYGVAALLGITGAMCYQIPYSRLVSTWFKKNFGFAQGLMSAGASVTPLLLIPIIVSVIYGFGWRTGYALIAALVLVVALPLAWLTFREKAEAAPVAAKAAPVDGKSAGEALRNVRLWLVFLGCSVATFAIGGFLSSIQPALLDNGWEVAIASAMSMVYLTGIIVGRIFGGILLDRFRPWLVPLVLCVFSGAAAFVLANGITTLPIAAIGLLVFILGLSQGADADFPAFFTLRLAGHRAFPAVLGIVGLMTGVSTTIGGFTFAFVRDSAGSYTPALMLGGVAYVVAGVLLFVAGLGEKKPLAAKA